MGDRARVGARQPARGQVMDPRKVRAIALCLLRDASVPNRALLELSLRSLNDHCERLEALALGLGDIGGPDSSEVRDAVRDVRVVLRASQPECPLLARVRAFEVLDAVNVLFPWSEGPRKRWGTIRRTASRLAFARLGAVLAAREALS